LTTLNGRPPLAITPTSTRDDGTRARLAAVVQSSAGAIVGETLEGIITDWNPAAERLYGYRAEEVIGRHLTMLIPPERLAEAAEILRRVRGGDHVADVETVRWTKDGQRRDVCLSVSPVWNDAGQIIATSAIVRDITERTATAKAVADSEALFRAAFENAPVGMILASPELRTLRVNRALCTMLGYTADELMATDLWVLTYPEDIEPNRVLMQRALAGDLDSYTLEKRYIHKDGHLVWGHLSGSLVRDAAGLPLYFVSQIENITARKAADEALAASEERFRLAFADAPIGMALVAADERVLQANRALCTMLGYTEAELVGTALRSRTHPDDIPANQSLVERARAGEFDGYALEKRYLRKDGQIVWASLTASCVRDNTGAIRYYLSQIQDITARKRAETQLRSALEAAEAGIRTKNLFLAMMSHELRTPLQAVLGYADFLLQGPPESLTSEQREDLASIRQGAGRMVTLIEQMLDLSRMEAGRLELATERVNIAEVIEQVRQDVAPQAGAKGLTLAIAAPRRLRAALGDQVRIRQILVNLVGNAIKFTCAGTVRITARATADRVTVAVQDTGIGITSEDLPHIFEEFRQIDSGLTRQYGGAGLGLAISRRLSEEMEGGISVESTPGTGSIFTLWLPSAPARSSATSRRRGTRTSIRT
jgi:PAS domain S-box-containing protein